MRHVLITVEVSRNQLNEALEAFDTVILPWDLENGSQVGAKIFGVWTNETGNMGEIHILTTWVDDEARKKLTELPVDEKVQKARAKWVELTTKATYQFWRPSPGSPLQ